MLSSDLMVPIPKWEHRCTNCSAETRSPGLCWSCKERNEKALDAMRSWRRRRPLRYQWADGLKVPELDGRVDPAALERARATDLASLDRATFLGPAGAGKTSLAIAMASDWVRRTGLAPVFASAPDLGVARQQSGLGDGEALAVDHAMQADLLVADDVGAEPPVGIPVIAHVLMHRHDKMKPTLCTSGLTVQQLVERYGSGIGRRLLETGGGVEVFQLKPAKATAGPSTTKPGKEARQ
jgi:DNA replication protein DnaC